MTKKRPSEFVPIGVERFYVLTVPAWTPQYRMAQGQHAGSKAWKQWRRHYRWWRSLNTGSNPIFEWVGLDPFKP